MADSTTVSGQATVVQAQILGLERVELSDTGALPPEGGALEATLLEYHISGVPDPLTGMLQAQVLHAAAVGEGNASRSEASVAQLTLTVEDTNIAAGFLASRAMAGCNDGDAFVNGSSELVALSINGDDITVSGEPNQTVLLPNGRVVINEQQMLVDSHFGEITVNALHVTIDNLLGDDPLGDVVVSSAHADVMCAGPPPPGNDFITGGGWITGTPSGVKANFGVAGGIKKNGTLWGHLTYIDHGDGLHVQGTVVMAYLTPEEDDSLAPECRRIEGAAKVNGEDGFTYAVTACDHGEPGRNDTFALSLPNGYNASGKLDGGNIQLH